jgi:hypothetical protein
LHCEEEAEEEEEQEEDGEEKRRALTIFTIINQRCSSHLRIIIGKEFLFSLTSSPFAIIIIIVDIDII